MRWFALSTRFLHDPKVEQLGEKHGPAGPLLWVALLTNAALQEMHGKVEVTYRHLAHELFVDKPAVEAILDDAIEIGLCHAMSRDVTGCLLSIPAWERHQAAFRKAKSRAAAKEGEKPHGKADVTRCHAMSRDVPYKTKQDKTKEKKQQGGRGGPGSRASVNRKPVTDTEYELASAIVVAFNEIAGTSLTVDAHLTPIVGRIRERPDLTAEQHRRIIEAVFAGKHWWDGPPAPRIIYGNAEQFEKSIEAARAAHRRNGGTAGKYAKYDAMVQRAA